MSKADSTVTKYSIVSGYFNPLHLGHLKLMQAARALSSRLIVIVNNDFQQVAKKGLVITPADQRLTIVQALRVVDEALISLDDDDSVTATLTHIRRTYPQADLQFCNGGDRFEPSAIPGNEAQVCRDLGITMHFGIGGEEKLDSSSRLLSAMSSPRGPVSGLEP